jgi:hypothetical protein
MVVGPPKTIKGGLSKGERRKLSGIKSLILEESGKRINKISVILIMYISIKRLDEEDLENLLQHHP